MAEQTGVDHGYIRVRSLSEEEENEINNEHLDEETEKALLGQDYTKESNQSMVGDQGISNFLKDIAKQNKQSQPTQYKGVNDKLLAKSAPKEKTPAQAKLAASHSPISGTSKGKVK
jgi:hypothetical protein